MQQESMKCHNSVHKTFLRFMYHSFFHRILCFCYFTFQVENDISDIYLTLHKSFEDETKLLVSTNRTGAVMKDQLCFYCVHLKQNFHRPRSVNLHVSSSKNVIQSNPANSPISMY